MKAVMCTQTSNQGVVKLTEFVLPDPQENEVTIKVQAASLNFPDLLQVRGLYQKKPPLPFIVGMEYSGIVTQAGRNVTKFKEGDRVAGMNQGAFATHINATVTSCYKVPKSVNLDDAATLTLAAGTAVYGLKHRGNLRSGETLIVMGAAGGTGRFAIQVGKILGAKVIAVCSSAEKEAECVLAGSDETINLSTANLSDEIKSRTAKRGADVIFDPVGGSMFNTLSRRMNWNGRLLTVGYAAGDIPSLPVNLALIKGFSLVGVHWDAALVRDETLAREIVADVFRFYDEGRLTTRIHNSYSFEQFADAFAEMKNRSVIGKIILRP